MLVCSSDDERNRMAQDPCLKKWLMSEHLKVGNWPNNRSGQTNKQSQRSQPQLLKRPASLTLPPFTAFTLLVYPAVHLKGIPCGRQRPLWSTQMKVEIARPTMAALRGFLVGNSTCNNIHDASTSFNVNSRTLMGCTDPHQYPL